MQQRPAHYAAKEEAMINPCMDIQIGEWAFTYGVNVEIEQDISTLTDTCTITVPRKAEWEGKQIALGDDPVLKRGDKVIVKLGYNQQYKTRFIGFVKEVKSGVPVQIICEDSMFRLKQNSLTLAYKGVSLQQLVADIVPAGIKYKVVSDKPVYIGQWRITKASAAKVLEELKSKYNIYSYFRNITTNGVTESVLYVGLAYWVDHRKEEVFQFGQNIIDAKNMVYRRKEDIKLKAKAISWTRDNKKIEVEVGDPEGEQRTVHAYGLTKQQLEVYAAAELERYKYTGYTGDFTTFGEPAVEKGDVVYLVGNKYHPEGKYLIKKVRIAHGVNGYRQIITPDSIINDKRASTGTAEG